MDMTRFCKNMKHRPMKTVSEQIQQKGELLQQLPFYHKSIVFLAFEQSSGAMGMGNVS